MTENLEPVNLGCTKEEFLEQFQGDTSLRIVVEGERLLAVVTKVTSLNDALEKADSCAKDGYCEPVCSYICMTDIGVFWPHREQIIKDLISHKDALRIITVNDVPVLSIQALRDDVEDTMNAQRTVSDVLNCRLTPLEEGILSLQAKWRYEDDQP